MKRKYTVGSGVLFLLIAGVVGYGIGLGLDTLIMKSTRFTAPVPSAFTLLFAFTAFFFGVYGYRGITRGLVYQILGTLIGGFIVTGIRALMGLTLFGGLGFAAQDDYTILQHVTAHSAMAACSFTGARRGRTLTSSG